MSVPDQDAPVEVMWTGRFIEAKRRGRWEYVQRTGGIGAAAIVAVHDGRLILVDQYRVPLGKRSLELPAGLVGDEEAGEAVEVAAARELEEETGFRPGRVEVVGRFHASPGMSAEGFTLVRAHDLTRVGAGGGVGGEGISVHEVPLDEVPAYMDAWVANGGALDVKLMLFLAGRVLG